MVVGRRGKEKVDDSARGRAYGFIVGNCVAMGADILEGGRFRPFGYWG